MQRKYYSARNNPKQNAINLAFLKEAIFAVWQDFDNKGYFQEYFGYYCVDAGYGGGFVSGKINGNVNSYVLRKVRKEGLWPFSEKYKQYSEEDLFDMIEFLFDHTSAPIKESGRYHNYNDCGWHYENFDSYKGQLKFVSEVNQFLNDYKDGYELTTAGEILFLGPEALRTILVAPIPASAQNIQEKMEYAVSKFRKYGSTIKEREESIRALADCLEYIRPKIKTVLTHKDEQDLFNIANNFAVRHYNENQKTNYDKTVWLSWMFYFYYSTLLACLHLLNKK